METIGTAGGGATLPGNSVLNSDEHRTSHSVPGIRSQQIAVQSPLVAETTVRRFKAALASAVAVVEDVEVSKLKKQEKTQSISLSSITEQFSIQSSSLTLSSLTLSSLSSSPLPSSSMES